MGRRRHSNKTRDVIEALEKDGWVQVRTGPGDHVQYKHPRKSGRVTVDTGETEIPTGTLRSIYRAAEWDW